MYEKLNEFLFMEYQNFYKGEVFHHHMNFNEFLEDKDIYHQIFELFLVEDELKKWYNNTYKEELRLKKMNRIIIE